MCWKRSGVRILVRRADTRAHAVDPPVCVWEGCSLRVECGVGTIEGVYASEM